MSTSLPFPELISDVYRTMNSGVTDFCRICVLSRLHSLTAESFFPEESVSEIELQGKLVSFGHSEEEPGGFSVCLLEEGKWVP